MISLGAMAERLRSAVGICREGDAMITHCDISSAGDANIEHSMVLFSGIATFNIMNAPRLQ